MRHTAALLVATVLIGGTVGCATSQTDQEGQPLVMGNAQPADSPVSDHAEHRLGSIKAASEVAVAGEIIAVRTPDALLVGTEDELEDATAVSLPLNTSCVSLNAQEKTFVVACGNRIYRIDARDANLDDVHTTDVSFDTATMTSSGEIIAASSAHNQVGVLRGGELSSFKVTDRGSQIVSVPVADGPDGVALINSEDTSIHGLDWTNNRPGPALRVGVGVGRIAPGEDGVVFASDTTGDQLAVYTVAGAIRLHQTHPVPDSPYALAWDNKHQVVWVSSTGTNTLTAFDISTGVPVEKATLASDGDIRGLAVRDDGALLTASPRDGLSIIPAATVHTALSEG